MKFRVINVILKITRGRRGLEKKGKGSAAGSSGPRVIGLEGRPQY